MTRALALFVFLSLCGCSLVSAYPSSTAELGELCHNDLDDDLDGTYDCDDPDCESPSCAETADAQCQNGRDDDADGLADWQDPGCFRFARLRIAHCAPIGPSDFAPTFGEPGIGVADSGWHSRGLVQPTLEPDPLDPGVLVARSGEDGALLESDPLAGALIGAQMHFEIFAPAGQFTSIGLVVDGDVGSYVPDGVQVVVDEGGNVFLAGSGVFLYRFPARWSDVGRRVSGTIGIAPHLDASGEALLPRMTASLFIDGRQWMFDAPRAEPFIGRAPGEISSAMTDGVPLRVRFLATGPDALLVSASAHILAFDACIDDGSPPTSPLLPHPVIGLARANDGVCAITRDAPAGSGARRALAHVSRDEGLHWPEQSTVLSLDELGIGMVGASRVEVSDVALTATETGGVAGVAAITRISDGRVVLLRLVESPDCITWSHTPSGLDDALPAQAVQGSLSYRIGEIDGVSGAHEISFVALGGTADGHIVRATSPSGADGTWALRSETTALPQPPVWIHQLFNGLRSQTVGRDRLFLFTGSRGLQAYVEGAPGTWTALETPLLAPSGLPGALDETAIAFSVLVFDPERAGEPLRGLVAYSGTAFVGPCPDCDVAAVVEPFEIVPR